MSRKLLFSMFFLIVVFALMFLMYFIFLVKFPKETWIEKFKSETPSKICRLFLNKEKTEKILESHNISNEKCISLFSESINRCIPQYFPKMPSEITKSHARKWGAQIGECASKDFSDKYLSGDLMNDTSHLSQ